MVLPLIVRLGAIVVPKDKDKSKPTPNFDVKIESNAKQLEKKIKDTGEDIGKKTKRALSITAQEGINIIEDRTKKGKGYKGFGFKRYSEKYARFRRFMGRTNRPNLEFTGRMLGSMTSKANNREAKIYFTRSAEAKKAAGNNKTRPFFGFNKQEKKALGKVFYRHMK